MWMRNESVQGPLAAIVAGTYLLFACGCGVVAPGGDDNVSATAQAVSAPSTAILGFESTSDWTTTGAGTEALSTVHSEGNSSLAVQGHGYSVITSKPLSSLGADVSSNVSLDFLLPAQQVNQWWYGSLQLFVTMPSKGIHNAYVGQQELTGLPLNVFNRVTFTLPPDLLTALHGAYEDLQFSIGLNVPSGSPGNYLLDNLNVGTVMHALDGETLFAGMFFGTGQVADRLGDLFGPSGSATTLSQGDRERLSGRLEQFATSLRHPAPPGPAPTPQAPKVINATSFLPADTYGNRNDGAGQC